MDIETDTIILPAFLASALINGDTSGIEDSTEDMALLQDALDLLASRQWQISDCGEPFFGRRSAIGGLAGDMCEYTVYRVLSK